MSLESLFQHILCSENQAEQSRRALREVRSDITRCREKMKKAAEELNEEQVKLESKVQQFSEKSFLLQLLKTHENALERQCSEITNQRNMLLQTFESTKKKVTEEEDKFLKEITDFNNEYEITKKRDLLMKENIRIEISVLENQANILKREMKSMERDSGQLNELQKQKRELIEELFTLQKKLKGFEDEENEAIHTTKYLEAEKIKINEKPQNDAECLRLKKELELYKEDDLESVYEALQTEIEFLELLHSPVLSPICLSELMPLILLLAHSSSAPQAYLLASKMPNLSWSSDRLMSCVPSAEVLLPLGSPWLVSLK
ncbi:coiled-coil domain-containing protein 172 [Lepus europaeus]|uniref:coiled-coil domain-containing protein 172 n=1 Tax=Lepus europaeus TaxID=9983 RepID=UPI002B45D39E|nr:coiled-coil domain-containing protein 172 [Lepus europaeus]